MSISTSRTVSSIVRATALILACASSSRAQSLPQLRDGFVISAGFGTGVASVHCAVCASGPGATAYARLGGAVHRDLILAGEVSTWGRSGNAISASQSDVGVHLSTIGMVAQWYPRVERGFFVEGGAGVGVLETRVADRLTGVRYRSGVSGGYELGAGYDYRTKKNFSFTPYATFFGVAPSHVADEPGSVYGNAVQIGLGLTKH